MVCHLPNAERRVNLRLFDAVAWPAARSEKTGVPQFVTRVKAEDAGNTGPGRRRLRAPDRQVCRPTWAMGRVEQASRWKCALARWRTSCTPSDKARAPATPPARGAEPFKSVVLSIASADGNH